MTNPSKLPGWKLLAATAGGMAAGGLLLWALSPSRAPVAVAESAPGEPVFGSVAVAPPPAPTTRENRLVIRRNDTLGTVIGAAGLSSEDAKCLLGALAKACDPRRVRPGHALVLVQEEDGRLVRAAYEAGPLSAFDVRRDGPAFVAEKRVYDTQTKVEAVSVTIESSLWDAFLAAGEDPSLVVAASDLLAWEIDFYRDVRSGDRIDLLVEKTTTADGTLVRYGDIHAVRYAGGVGLKEFYRYDRGGRPGFYDAQGRSARRAFLKQPLPLVRITSRYGVRKHPTLGYQKKHEGVDYGAPTGTPVWAVGDGKVVHAGYKGANGNLVSIRHANGFTSHYAHLSKIAAAVRVGANVSQKQVIAFVGTTGRSTGPHLHFALAKGGHSVNPLNQSFPAGDPVPAAERATFVSAISPLQVALERPRLFAAREP